MIWIPFYLLQFLIFLLFYIFQIVFSENNLVEYHYCINFNLVLSIKFSLIFLYNFCTDFPIYYCSCISFQLTLSSDDHVSFIFHKFFLSCMKIMIIIIIIITCFSLFAFLFLLCLFLSIFCLRIESTPCNWCCESNCQEE